MGFEDALAVDEPTLLIPCWYLSAPSPRKELDDELDETELDADGVVMAMRLLDDDDNDGVLDEEALEEFEGYDEVEESERVLVMGRPNETDATSAVSNFHLLLSVHAQDSN